MLKVLRPRHAKNSQFGHIKQTLKHLSSACVREDASYGAVTCVQNGSYRFPLRAIVVPRWIDVGSAVTCLCDVIMAIQYFQYFILA
jgi:hypothetical protein